MAAFKIASTIVAGTANVLIYCQTGTVGTPVLTSLAQVICDPFYRTFEGLQTLIHKEWLYYKYDFCKKGRVIVNPSEPEGKIEPIFIFFLDALAQIVKMNPIAFEYKSTYLAFLASEQLSNRFFEFIQGPLQDDKAAPLPTVFGVELRVDDVNLVYEVSNSLVYSPKYVEYWDDYFGRFQPKS